MKTTRIMLGLLLTLATATPARAQISAFTYQGRLNLNGVPANGHYDFMFRLLNDPANGVAAPVIPIAVAVPVSNGLFTTGMDFGAENFDGANRWLEISVCTNGNGSFTTLSPRQALTPTPYAVTADAASNLLGALPAGQISGTIPNASLPASPSFSGALTASHFSGNGSTLTNLNPGNIAWQPSLRALGTTNLAVAFLGDSWIYGGKTGQKPYVVALLTNRFYAGRTAASTNAAADGANLGNMWEQWTNGGVKSWTEAQIAAGRTVHVHLHGGINNFGTSAPTNHVSIYSNFCKAIRATGAKVVAYTIPAFAANDSTRAGGEGDQWWATKNRMVRELVDENGARLWDYLVDTGAWLTDPWKPPYKAGDAVHLSEPDGWLEMARFADAELWRGAHRESVHLLLSSGTLALPLVEGSAVNPSYPLGSLNFQRAETNVAFWGTGTNQPEGNVLGQVGSLYVCLADGKVWSKTSGSSNTGWAVVGSGCPTNILLSGSLMATNYVAVATNCAAASA